MRPMKRAPYRVSSSIPSARWQTTEGPRSWLQPFFRHRVASRDHAWRALCPHPFAVNVVTRPPTVSRPTPQISAAVEKVHLPAVSFQQPLALQAPQSRMRRPVVPIPPPSQVVEVLEADTAGAHRHLSLFHADSHGNAESSNLSFDSETVIGLGLTPNRLTSDLLSWLRSRRLKKPPRFFE